MLKQSKESQKLTLKKPLSLEKESQIYQQIKRLKPAQNFNIEGSNRSQHTDKADQKKSSQKSDDDFKKALNWLLKSFPRCFNLKEPLPLKRHIELDIFKLLPVEGSISKASIRAFIAYYTDRILYHNAILARQHRFNLEGNPVNQITHGEKEYSKKRLEWKEAPKEKNSKQSTILEGKAADK